MFLGFTKSEPATQAQRPEGRASAWCEARIAKGRKERFHEIVTITPAMAAELLKHNTGNRPLNERRAETIAHALEEGRWRLTSESIAVSRDGVLLDGQHRLRGVELANVPMPATVWFGCDPEEFEVIGQGAKRSGADMASIANIPHSAQAAAMATLLIIYDRGAVGTVDANLVYRKVLAISDRPEFMPTMLAGARLQKICTKSAATIAYWHIATRSASADKLPEFWDALVSGAGLTATSPILRLRNMLTLRRQAMDGRHHACRSAGAIVIAWNQWLRGHRKGSLEWAHVVKLPDPL